MSVCLAVREPGEMFEITFADGSSQKQFTTAVQQFIVLLKKSEHPTSLYYFDHHLV